MCTKCKKDGTLMAEWGKKSSMKASGKTKPLGDKLFKQALYCLASHLSLTADGRGRKVADIKGWVNGDVRVYSDLNLGGKTRMAPASLSQEWYGHWKLDSQCPSASFPWRISESEQFWIFSLLCLHNVLFLWIKRSKICFLCQKTMNLIIESKGNLPGFSI